MILSKKQVEFLEKYIEDLNLLIEEDNVNDISDIASVSMISQEYGEFRFFRKYNFFC